MPATDAKNAPEAPKTDAKPVENGAVTDPFAAVSLVKGEQPKATRKRERTAEVSPKLVEAIRATHNADQYAVIEVDASNLKSTVSTIRRAGAGLGLGTRVRMQNAEGKNVKVPGTTGNLPEATGKVKVSFKGTDPRKSDS